MTYVRVEGGMLAGDVARGVYRFLGVPYAAPPIGAGRFASPRPHPGWTRTRAATTFASPSYQLGADNLQRVAHLAARWDPGVPGVLPFPPAFSADTILSGSSEDCLYLDIYAPKAEPGEKLPVFVYFHGGANVTNSASGRYEFQSGENLAREERVVVVQPQYRLGALGWMHLGMVDGNHTEAVNLGAQDQLAALAWIWRNCPAFRGDPDNITIGGESAGGTAVSHLITNPTTRRYARRAIIQSLSPFNTWSTQRPAEAAMIADTYQRLLAGRAAEADPDELLAIQGLMIRLFDPDALVAWRPHGAVVDGNLIRDLPVLALTESDLDAPDFEVMIGFAKDEWQFFRGHTPTMQNADRPTAVAVLSQVFGAEAESVYDRYASLHPSHPPAHCLADILSMVYFKFSSLEIAERLSVQGNTVYVFQYSYDHPGLDGYLRALHTGTLPFIFRNYSAGHRRAWRSLDGAPIAVVARLANDFGTMYGGFIRNGDPGPSWGPYDRFDENVLWFGDPIQSHPHLLSSEREAFKRSGITRTAQLEERMLANVRQVVGPALERLGKQ